MVVIGQEKQITSWEIPMLVNSNEAIYSYHNTSRTLCFSSLEFYSTFYRSPLKSLNEANKRFSLTLSTFSPIKVTVEIFATEFKDYFIKKDVNYTVEVSPSEPVFYYYSFIANNNNHESVFIDIDSIDDHCVVVSIQKSFVSI